MTRRLPLASASRRLPAMLEGQPFQQLHFLLERMLAHRDGAAVVAGTYANEPATLDVAEAFVAALLDGGLSEREAAWTCWGVIYFILGLCQEEQALSQRSSGELTPGERPALEKVLPFLAEESFEERFEFGVAKLLAR